MRLLFENRFDQVMIEFRDEARKFGDGETALEWVMTTAAVPQRQGFIFTSSNQLNPKN